MSSVNSLHPAREVPPLVDLLGASFVFKPAVTALAWDRDFACFGLADGAVAMLRAHWDHAPRVAHRAGGGVEIVAGTAPPPPPAIFFSAKGGVLALAGDPLGGVLVGGGAGDFTRLADGEISVIERGTRRKTLAVAAGRGGRRAFARGRSVDVFGPDAARLMMPAAVTALAYDPSGLHLAVGHAAGISLEACGIRTQPRLAGDPCTMLAWRQDGSAVAAASAAGVVLRQRANAVWESIEGIPGAPQSLAFGADGTLVIGGADFLVFAAPGETARAAGAENLRAPVACHPRRNIFACADRDGRILLGEIGAPPNLLLRDEGAAPRLMAFAPDGEALAFAAADGEAGTISLPDILFRAGRGPDR